MPSTHPRRPQVTTRPLGGSFGLTLEPAGRAAEPGPPGPLAALDPEEVAALFREHGALLFHDFGASRDQFLAFTETLSRDFSTYQGGFFRDRQRVGNQDTLLTVTGSQEGFAIPLHGEMYYTARQPGLLWFFCEKPAEQGGETTLCDGEEIFRRLSDRTRQLFLEKRIRYVRRLPDGVWQEAFGTGDPAEAERLCGEQETSFEIDPATGAVETSRLAWAVVPGRSGQRDTFINNLVSLYMGELSLKRGTAAETIKGLSGRSFPIVVRMEDGSPVPGAVIKELLALNQRHAVAVPWSAGDIVLVDNTRILHGRLAYSGERNVYVRLGERAF
jgi:alpha-ketoglutarate-dependent taurine dioxygenase